MDEMRTIGVIPARFGSSRFPGKPLQNILGKSLIQRTYENTKKCSSLDLIVIATDDHRIASHVEEFGAKVFMTSPRCNSGTERTCVIVQEHFPNADIVVNIQGDEPCLPPHIIDTLVDKMKKEPNALVTTPVSKIVDQSEIFDPSIVKCVFNLNKEALYFSRAILPFPKNTKKIHDFYRHVGVYCFRKEFLLKMKDLRFSRLQEIEDLEQLQILENGFPIHVCVVEDNSIGVNTPEDIEKVEKLICQENTYSLQEA